MPKQESTAINDLIHLVQGRVIDHSGDAQDNLFVTARPPAPLPRRRAPHATPPIVPVHAAMDYDDEDSATAVDPQLAIGSAPNPRPSAPGFLPLQYAVPAYPQPILPQYAYPTPAPLPPMPYHADCDATERVAQYDEIPQQEWHVRPALPPRVARAPGPFEEHLDTVRVAALPRPRDLDDDDAPRSELVSTLQKCALPFAGLAIAMMFVGGYVVHGGQGGHKREVPVVMTVTPPSQAVAAAAVSAPVVTPITISAALVTDESAPPATWKPTAVQPTIAPEVETVAVGPADDEIEMAATTVAKPHHRRTKRASAPARVVARAAPAPSASPRGRRSDPIAVALAEPTKPAKAAAKGTGPGKVTITSTPAALIYIDGRSTNQMTPKTLTLAPGVHKITLLEVSSRKAKTAEVDVAAGGSAQIAKKF